MQLKFGHSPFGLFSTHLHQRWNVYKRSHELSAIIISSSNTVFRQDFSPAFVLNFKPHQANEKINIQ